jgi:acyl-CoA thioester hydrolase
MNIASTSNQLTGEYALNVYYEDTDFTGFVYHANYLKFCERAREHLFGIDNLRDAYLNKHHFVVRSMQIRFHKPAHHGDQLLVKSSCTISPVPRWNINQKIYRTSKDSEPELIFSAQVEIVHIGSNGAPARLDSKLLDQFARHSALENERI